MWGVAGGTIGGVVARMPGVTADVPLAIPFALLGLAAGTLFSAVLTLQMRNRSAHQLSLPKFAAWGALSGLSLSGLIVLGAVLRGDDAMREFVLFGPALVVAGAACAAGSLALVRRASRPTQ
jgi:hypothetical protein